MMDTKLENFKRLLDARHKWPCDYLFKFIVKNEVVAQTVELFKGNSISFKESAKGNYVSLSITMKMNSSDEVLAVYAKATAIPGIISL